MLCSRLEDTWQIGTTSIREDHWIASGLRFVHWRHASPNVQARQNRKNDPTVRVYQHLEDQLTKAGADTDDILALNHPGRGHESTQLFLHCRREGQWGVAYGWSTGVHEVATLFALTQNPCQKWEDLGYGKAALLYQRTQHVLKAARLLPAHRRLPHQAFLSGLWWKLLSLQPLRLLAYLPVLGCLRPAAQEDPTHFTVNGFSAGSYTGAVIALAIRCLWPASQITARLGATAMPKSVLAALVATAEPDRHNNYLVHAAEDCLCDWKPTENELDMLQRSLHITYVTDSARWMGKHKHCYWHWLQCQLPTGKVSLTTLKLTHPDVVPRRDRIAAPMRLASWIRFETVMTSDDWEGAISLLVSNLHRPDQELLGLLQSCVAGQQIASMEEAQALLLKNFRVGKGNPSACAQWLTEMARDLLAPIPFREVFVILALFLPQLTFVDEATTRQELWSSPTVRKYGLVVDVTPTATKTAS